MQLGPKEFYKSCNLTTNPFRSNPTHESDPRMNIWVGYDKEKKLLVKYLERTRADQVGNINFVMIYGDYGTGKSHALLWSKHQILEARKPEFNSLVFYIHTLKKDAGKLSFAGALREDIVGRSNLVAEVLMFRQFLEECAVEYRRDKNLGPEVARDDIIKQLLKSSELINCAQAILQCQNESAVKEFLTPKGLGDYQAMVTLTSLINLLVYEIELPHASRRFKKAAYLLIDELDLLATSTAKEAREVNDLLRHIYDNCPNCFCLVLAFTATAAELNVLFAEYVLSRVSRQIKMDLLGIDDAKLFVRDILDQYRISKGGKRNYFPFTEDAVESVVSQIPSITPQKVVNYMQQILEEVRLLGFEPANGAITADFLNDNDVINDVVGTP
jgi:hypothetical protein